MEEEFGTSFAELLRLTVCQAKMAAENGTFTPRRDLLTGSQYSTQQKPAQFLSESSYMT